MEILHLEDFSNETQYVIASRMGQTVTIKEPPGTRTYDIWGGGYLGLTSSSVYSGSNSSAPYRAFLSGTKYIETGGNRLTVRLEQAQGAYWGASGGNLPFDIIKLDLHDVLEPGTRTIHAFDYTPDDVITQYPYVRMALLNHSNVELGFQALHGLTRGRIELVQESGWLKVYKDSVLIISRAHTGPVSLSARLVARFDAAKEKGVDGVYFHIENLAIIRAPIESPIKRLSNYHVKRSDVVKINDDVQLTDAPVNNRKVLTDPGVELMGNNTLSFEPPQVSGTERIMGVQTTISVKSPDADTIRMALNNADTVLSEKDVELDALLLARVSLPAVDLGDKPVDYNDHTLHIDIKELEL